MARKRKASGLGGALKAHAKDETTYRQEFIDLPPGINGGIAEIADAKLGVYQSGDNQGERFLYLAGVVLEPESVTYSPKVWKDGKVTLLDPVTVEVKGQRTSQTLPLCDTTTRGGKEKSQNENVSVALNHLRMLGGEDFTEDLQSQEDLEALLETLLELAPYFKFSTSGGTPTAEYPEPRTWENWHGSKDLEGYEPEEPEGITDATGEGEGDIPFDAPEEEPPEEEEGSVDLVALGKAADAGDEEAEEKLTELAEAAEVDPDDIETWEEVGQTLQGKYNSKEEPESWEVGEVCKYKVPKKRVAAYEIIEISGDGETCTLQHCATEAVIEGVLIGNLIPPD
jgi:hypothetical protein